MIPWGERASPPSRRAAPLTATPGAHRAGATAVRRAAVKTILAGGRVDVVKGNEGEIRAALAAAGEDAPQQRGVDSGPSALDEAGRGRLAAALAARERCVVVLTGAADVVSDGHRTFAVRHGHELLGQVTGTGCCLGTAISAAVAVHPDDKLISCVAAMLLYEGAAEVAARRDDVRGPGSFVPAFLDELARCRRAAAEGDMSWLGEPRVERLDI